MKVIDEARIIDRDYSGFVGISNKIQSYQNDRSIKLTYILNKIRKMERIVLA